MAQLLEDSRSSVEFLDHGHLASDQRIDDALSIGGTDVMVQPHELGKRPVQDRNHDGSVLQVWIDAVIQMCSITLIANVVDHPESTRQMNTHAFGEGARSELWQCIQDPVCLELWIGERRIAAAENLPPSTALGRKSPKWNRRFVSMNASKSSLARSAGTPAATKSLSTAARSMSCDNA